MDEEQPDYLAVAFDVHAPTFRHIMYEAYKGTRKGMPEELREQVPVMKELLRAMGISIYEQAGLEADDILGTVGTINFDYRSLYLHFECGVLLYKTQSVMKIKEDFMNILSVCQEITLEDTKNVKWTSRVIRSILRLIAPLI